MNPHYTYLLVDIGSILFPLLFSFDKRMPFYKTWRYLWTGLLFTGAFFIAWDVLFTVQGVWSFNDKYVLGLKMAGLPVEEWLFFLAIPYSCVFIYECLNYYLPALDAQDWGNKIMLPLGFVLLITGLANATKAYTFTAFAFSGFALILLHVGRRRFPVFKASRFFAAYAISLIPFFIVNGILTAMPVVLYNNTENLGIRMYTIPFEDTFYGMLLLLGNVVILEWRRGKVNTSLPSSVASVNQQ